MPGPDLTYNALNSTEVGEPKLAQIPDKSYQYYTEENSAIFEHTPEQWLADPNVHSPWQIQLNVDKASLPQAWDLILPILTANNVPRFTVSRLSENEDAQITISIPPGQEFSYNNLIAQIEQTLLENEIKPGQFEEDDKKVGVFTTVRNTGIAGACPFVVQESELQAYFAKHFTTYLTTSDYAQGRITGGTIGMLSRLFDEFPIDPTYAADFNKLSESLLANTQKAAEEGNLAGYLSQFARGMARSLFNPEMTDLSDSLKKTIGDENYQKLLTSANGNAAEIVAKLIQASIIFHSIIFLDAVGKKDALPKTEEELLEREQAARKFAEEITTPVSQIQTTLTAEDLLSKEFLPSPKNTIDQANIEAANADLEKWADETLPELKNKCQALKNNATEQDKSRLGRLERKLGTIEDNINGYLQPVSEEDTIIPTGFVTKTLKDAARLEQLVKLEELVYKLDIVEKQVGNYVKSLAQEIDTGLTKNSLKQKDFLVH